MAEYTPHQKKIIARYYDRRDEIMLNRLGEIVSELYLAETDPQRSRLWDRAKKAMAGLQVPESVVSHILDSRDPEVLGRNLKGWLRTAEKSRGGDRDR